MENDKNGRRVSVGLLFGIVLLPGIFVWFLLRKGHSRGARFWGFSWLIIAFLLTIFGNIIQQSRSYNERQKEGEDYTLSSQNDTQQTQISRQTGEDVNQQVTFNSSQEEEKSTVNNQSAIKLWSGKYSSHFEGADGEINITPLDMNNLYISISASSPSCTGNISFSVPVPKDNYIRHKEALGDNGLACGMLIRHIGTSLVLQEDSCGAYHGVQCDFVGTARLMDH